MKLKRPSVVDKKGELVVADTDKSSGAWQTLTDDGQ